jgi:hypothetical protein
LVPVGPLLAGTAAAGTLSAVVTGLLFLHLRQALATDFAIPFRGPEAPLEAMPLVMVLVAASAPVLLAAGMLALFGFFIERPLPLFGLTALLVFLFSLAAPFALPEITTATRNGLYLLHAAASFVLTSVLAFTWRLQSGRRRPID